MSNINISSENAIRAFNTLKYFCKSSDDRCCINGIRCPFDDGNCKFMAGDMPYQWKIHQEETHTKVILLEEMWEDIKEEIRDEFELSQIAYKTWIEPLVIQKIKCRTVTVGMPENSGIEYIKAKYQSVLQRKFFERIGKKYNFYFVAIDIKCPPN